MTIKKIDTSQLKKAIDDYKAQIPEKLDYSKIHKEHSVDINVKPIRQPVAISIGVDEQAYKGVHYPIKFATFGNISMIKGEEKSRKTWAKSLILACAIGGNSNLYAPDIKSQNLEGKYIIDIDTEQDANDAWDVAHRVFSVVGSISE